MKSIFNKSGTNLFLKVILVSTFLISSIISNAFNKKLKTHSDLFIFQDSIVYTEKVFLHFDKPYYSSGEIMWFKTYLISANTNKPDAKSKIVHVELIDNFNKIINSRTIKIEEGGGEGEFYLPKRLNSGEYTIRAYSNFMRNFDESYFFHKKINIENIKSLAHNQSILVKKIALNYIPNNIKPDIQFFPEGGYLVNNKTSKVGFKAINSNGKSIVISGSILDSNNNEILTFKTLKFGLGKFELTPKKDVSYKVIISYKNNNYTYDLPQALNKGVTMKVTEQEDKYQVLLQSSLPRGVHRLTLTGLQNGKMVIVRQLIGGYKTGIIEIPKEHLNQGIVQFTISDKNQKPLCERLVFVETKASKSNVTITPTKTEYQKRELVELDLSIDSIFQANTSLTVTDISIVNHNLYGLDIKSYLLLNSELKGEIEQPGYYFDPKNKDRKETLDLLMMTQGWRQFLWNHSNNDQTKEDRKKYAHETGIRIKGIVKNKSNLEKTTLAEVSLIYMNKNELVEDKMWSRKNGQFQFGDYHFSDSTSVIIQAKNYKIKKRKKKKDTKKLIMDYSIVLDTFTPHPITSKFSYYNNLEATHEVLGNDYLIRSKMVRLNAVIPFDDDSEKLDEIIVKHTRIKKEIKEKFKNRQTIYGTPTYRVDMDDIQTFGTNNVMAALQGKVPGLRMGGNIDNPTSIISFVGGESSNRASSSPGRAARISRARPVVQRNYQLTVRGSSVPPLILLNNFEVQDFSTILAVDVSFVDILSPARSVIYGSRGMGGVISIHTKRGNEGIDKSKKDKSGIINFIHPGYYKARKFYEPNYKIKKPEHKNFDYRTTIYWNPTIELNNNGKTKISFYAADIETIYRIELQGISKNGIPIKKEVLIDVN